MRLLLIEDDIDLLNVMKKGLQSMGFTCDSASNGFDGLELFYANIYDAILLDLNLPDIDGLDILKEVRKDGNMPVLIVSARNTTTQRITGLDLGADDYIVKPFDFIELKARIHAIIRRTYGRSSSDISISKLLIKTSAKMVFYNGIEISLSNKEYDVLEMLALNYPNIISAESIISHIYDDSFDPFSSVLRVHFANLRKKLHKVNDEINIETIKGIGYRLWIK